MSTETSQDIRDRAFRFGCDVARLALALAPLPGVRCIVDQLLRAGTAIGANLEEARSSSSRREFLRYLQISLRESRETLYWLRICAALELGPPKTVSRLKDESDEITRILASIVVNTKRRMLVGAGVFLFCILNFEF